MLERQIIIGLITSTEFIQLIRNQFEFKYLKSQMAKRLAKWCIDYYDKYNKSPGVNIEGIYYEKLQQGLPKNIAEEIEQDILPDLSEEYEKQGINVKYLFDQTVNYFKSQHLNSFSEEIKSLVETGDILKAEDLAIKYQPSIAGTDEGLDLSSDEAIQKVRLAFNHKNQQILEYPRQLGEFWNDQLVRGAFVAFMSPEKRGKTFRLMEMAIRGARNGKKVAFFQAGDMTEFQQLIRIGVHLAQKSNNPRYCGEIWEPVRDCVNNQRDVCNKAIRESEFGVFEDRTEKQLRKEIQFDELIEASNDNPDYKPCYNCPEYWKGKTGTIWLKKVNVGEPLTGDEAAKMYEDFFKAFHRTFKLSTHPNGTLSVKKIHEILNVWERKDGFVPDLIAVDYADILIHEFVKEERHRQNQIWKELRGLNQEKDCLLITATQTDADSYERNLLKQRNFSEDKRKYGHVTAMYGLNQDHNEREKKLGIVRINELVIREGEFETTRQIHVLQNLKRGQPYLASYW